MADRRRIPAQNRGPIHQFVVYASNKYTGQSGRYYIEIRHPSSSKARDIARRRALRRVPPCTSLIIKLYPRDGLPFHLNPSV